jgi:Mg/Co/Ni transporter MgtE
VTPSETENQADTPRISLRLSAGERFELDELRAAWPVLSLDERVAGFELLDREQATEFFLERTARGQAQIIQGLPSGERRLWIRLLPPDDAADALQEVPPEERGRSSSCSTRSRAARSRRCSPTPRTTPAA